jgi:hypothetical protein
MASANCLSEGRFPMMRPLRWLLPALLLLTNVPALAEGASSGARKPVPSAPGVEARVPVTDELLARWELDPVRYRALGAEEKQLLQDQLARLEAGRLEQLRQLEVAAAEECLRNEGTTTTCAQAWKTYVTAQGRVDAQGERLLHERATELAATPVLVPAALEVERADGKPLTTEDLSFAGQALDRIVSGLERLRRGPAKFPFNLDWDVHFRNGTLYSLTTTHPESGISIEVGQLGADGRSALLGKSWYGNLTKRWESQPESRVDYRIHTQVGYVNLQARFFDDQPDDPRVDRAIDLMQSLGVSDRRSDSVRSYLDYDNRFRTQGMIVSSLLAEVGRAHHLFGPLDLAWTVGNVTRIVHFEPNTAFDETLGLRVHLAENVYLGVFGGLSQNLAPLHSEVVNDAVNLDGLNAGLDFEYAPHATISLWGEVPRLSNLRFQVSAGSRWNQSSSVQQGEISLLTTVFHRTLGLRGSYSRERGQGIDYDREQLHAQLDYQVHPRTRLYVAHERERIGFGSARVESSAIFAGVEMSLGDHGSTVTMDHLFGGSYDEVSRLNPELPSLVQRVSKTVGDGVEIAAKARDIVRRMGDDATESELAPALRDLAASIQRMPLDLAFELLRSLTDLDLTQGQTAELRELFLPSGAVPGARTERLGQLLSLALGDASPWGKELDSAASYSDAHEAEIRELVTLLGSANVWNAVLVRAGRAALVESLRNTNVSIPLGFADVKVDLSAPVVLAAANWAQGKLSPLAPVTQQEVQASLVRLAANGLGLDGNAATEQGIVDHIFTLGDHKIEDELARRLSSDLQPVLANPATYTPGRTAEMLLATLPPQLAASLQARYGAGLASLLPAAGASGAELEALLLGRVPGELTSLLKEQYRGEASVALAQMTAWAAEILEYQINATLLQLLLASEELNRLTVDHGVKIPDWSVRMAMDSFRKLDQRSHDVVPVLVGAAAGALAKQTSADEARLAAHITTYGRDRLAAVTQDRAWPRGLTVEVPEQSWPPLISLYGDGPLFDFIEKIGAAQKGVPDGLAVAIDFDPEKPTETSIQRHQSPRFVRITLGRARDERDAQLQLAAVERQVLSN